MSEISTQSSSHLRPYDLSLEDKMTMYDKQPYTKDIELCGTGQVKLVSGNVVKFYTQNYKMNDPYIISNKDDEMNERLRMLEEQFHQSTLAKESLETDSDDVLESEDTFESE